MYPAVAFHVMDGRKIGPPIECFIRWAEVIPTHAVVDGQVLGGSPVIRKVDTNLVHPYSRKLVVVVVCIERREAKQETGGGIAALARWIPRVSKRGGEIETAVALV